MRECKENGNLFREKCVSCPQELLICKKYGGQCMSNKCLGERADDSISTLNKV